MARSKITLEEQINNFLDVWDEKKTSDFFRDILPLFKLYNITEEDDWLADEVGGDEENVRTIRLLRTVYLMSKLISHFSPVFCELNIIYKGLWEKMEKQGMGQPE